MPRPQHLSCPNTAEGIRRINEMQENYDSDPQAYERREREENEQREREKDEVQHQQTQNQEPW